MSIEGRCASHPDVASVAVCARCGDYHCAQCHKQVAGRALCANCRALPGVDYLEDTRQRFWGKRDAYVWYFGVFVPLVALGSMRTVVRAGDAGHVIASLVWMAALIAYFARVRALRLGLIVLTIADILLDGLRFILGLKVVPADTPISPEAQLKLQLFGGAVGLLFVLAAYRSPRNKLAFEIPVSDAELQRVYDRYLSNPLAVRALVYSALCVLLPFVNVLTLVMSLRALRVANAEAWPPRGGRLPAMIGAAVSSLGILSWILMASWLAYRRHHLGT